MSRIKNTIFQRQGARQQPHTQKCQDQENGRKETCPEHTRLLPNFERPLRLSSRGRSGPTGEERGDASQGKGQTPRSQESRKKRHVQKHKHTPPNFERLFAPRWLRLPTHIKKIRFLWLKPISFQAIFCFKLKKIKFINSQPRAAAKFFFNFWPFFCTLLVFAEPLQCLRP